MGQIERVALKHTLPYVKEPVGICCMTQVAQAVLCDNPEEWDRVGGMRKV